MIAQAMIGIFGVLAVWLSQHGRADMRKWACVCGLLAQPAWFYTTAVHGQWGIFALSFLYTWSWANGIKTYWLKEKADV